MDAGHHLNSENTRRNLFIYVMMKSFTIRPYEIKRLRNWHCQVEIADGNTSQVVKLDQAPF